MSPQARISIAGSGRVKIVVMFVVLVPTVTLETFMGAGPGLSLQ
ncbi:hypothetical protein [Actinomadura fibrosa]|uniref:Uncharacterized protein n=1 Tax=Actinomadura fibrosa TaxID=111802 RepID=A0ABW2XZ45_9ACTN|nr:hypothetical protein [Actinomadura fibrosa]